MWVSSLETPYRMSTCASRTEAVEAPQHLISLVHFPEVRNLTLTRYGRWGLEAEIKEDERLRADNPVHHVLTILLRYPSNEVLHTLVESFSRSFRFARIVVPTREMGRLTNVACATVVKVQQVPAPPHSATLSRCNVFSLYCTCTFSRLISHLCIDGKHLRLHWDIDHDRVQIRKGLHCCNVCLITATKAATTVITHHRPCRSKTEHCRGRCDQSTGNWNPQNHTYIRFDRGLGHRRAPYASPKTRAGMVPCSIRPK